MTTILDVDHRVISSYILHVSDVAVGRSGKPGLSPATIARRLAAVSSYCDFMRSTKHAKFRNPVRDIKRRWKRNNKPKPVEESVLDFLLCKISSLRDRTLILLFLDSGLRLPEMAQLDRTSIVMEEIQDQQTGEVSYLGTGEVNGKGDKTRDFHLSRAGCVVLSQYLITRSDKVPALFLSERRVRMATRSMQERLAYWCKAAGSPHVNLHRLRHTYATRLVNAGIDILHLKELMGHNSLSTTLQYAKISDSTLARGYHSAMERCDPVSTRTLRNLFLRSS